MSIREDAIMMLLSGEGSGGGDKISQALKLLKAWRIPNTDYFIGLTAPNNTPWMMGIVNAQNNSFIPTAPLNGTFETFWAVSWCFGRIKDGKAYAVDFGYNGGLAGATALMNQYKYVNGVIQSRTIYKLTTGEEYGSIPTCEFKRYASGTVIHGLNGDITVSNNSIGIYLSIERWENDTFAQYYNHLMIMSNSDLQPSAVGGSVTQFNLAPLNADLSNYGQTSFNNNQQITMAREIWWYLYMALAQGYPLFEEISLHENIDGRYIIGL